MLWPVLSMNFAPGRLQAVLALHKGLFPAQAWDFTIKKKKKKTISTTEDRGFVLVYRRKKQGTVPRFE